MWSRGVLAQLHPKNLHVAGKSEAVLKYQRSSNTCGVWPSGTSMKAISSKKRVTRAFNTLRIQSKEKRKKRVRRFAFVGS